MSAILRKHRAGSDVDAEDAVEMLEEEEGSDSRGSDPRWDALRGMGSPDDQE